METPIVYVPEEALARHQDLEAAKKCLEALRYGTPRAEAILAQLRYHVAEAGCQLADLGTSVDELDELVRSGLRMRAMIFLRELRLAGYDEADYVDIIYSTCREAGCKLADIGTTARELDSFLPRPRKRR